MARSRSVKKKAVRPVKLVKKDSGTTPLPESFKSRKGLGVLFIWTAFAAVTLTFPNFSWLSPTLAKQVPFQQSLFASLVLFVGLIAAIRLLPERNEENDVSPWVSRFLLLVCLGLGAFLCLYHIGTLPRWYSDDCASNIFRVREVADTEDFRGFFSARLSLLPLWLLTGTFLCHLLPDASSLFIQRLNNTVYVLGAIGVLYLVGKEIAGRRMGLFAAGLAAVSKPLLQFLVVGWCYGVISFGLSLVFLFSFRLMKKTDLPHFLYWGGAIGFLGYTNFYFSPFVPFFIFLTWIWLFIKGVGKDSARPSPLVWVTFFILLIYFLSNLNAFSAKSWIYRTVHSDGLWVPGVALGLLLVCLVLYAPKMVREKNESPWLGWVAGSWFAAVISYPMVTNQEILTRIQMNTLSVENGFLSGPYLWAALHRVSDSFKKLFWAGSDRFDMSIEGDAFFSYPEVILIALGLAFCLAKPNLKRVFILVSALMAVSVHFFANSSHGGRLQGCPPSFLLLGALGLNELIKLFLNSNKSRVFLALVSFLLIGFWGWSAKGIFSRVYTQWAEVPKGITTLRDQAIRDIDRGDQVYIASCDGNEMITFEGHPVHLWNNNQPNVIYVGADEKGPDVVLYETRNADLRKKLLETFPKAILSDLRESDDPNRITAHRLQIPFSSLSNPKQKFVRVVSVPSPYWHRTYCPFTMGFGLLDGDNKTARVNEPSDPEPTVPFLRARYQATVHFKQDRVYEFACKTNNRTEIRVDGKRLMNIYFPRTNFNGPPSVTTETKTISLGAGNHDVEVKTCFQEAYAPPDITVLSKGSGEPARSLWSSFEF